MAGCGSKRWSWRDAGSVGLQTVLFTGAALVLGAGEAAAQFAVPQIGLTLANGMASTMLWGGAAAGIGGVARAVPYFINGNGSGAVGSLLVGGMGAGTAVSTPALVAQFGAGVG